LKGIGWRKRRKLQIRTRIPERDRQAGFGCQHLVSREQLEDQFNAELARAVDLSDRMAPFR
jgi:hypothetical protein